MCTHYLILLYVMSQEVDGKQIQIQLTGFMEKNTGKFMKELWVLLLSAQKNASGVPQQFLDEKEEEMKKKMVCVAVSRRYRLLVVYFSVTVFP